MKKIATIILLLFGTASFSQETEFGKSNNGLIYSDTTVKQLKFIVDSLNLKFKVCELNKTYLSKFQAKAHFVSVESGKIKDAKKDIEANISFDDFIKKYSKSKFEKELLVVKFKYKNYEEKDVIEFSSIELNSKYEHNFTFENNLKNYDEPLKGKWIYRYYDKTEYSKESIEAFYFVEEFSQKSIPDIYARMIQYSDCMVDTSTQIYYKNAQISGVRYRNEEPSKSKEFTDYIHKSTKRPEYKTEYSNKDFEIYSKKYQL